VSQAVYVQIPAYRDSELAPTLRDLYARATNPSRLHTCVVWQHVHALPGLELVDVPADASEGCNWARRIAQDRWAGEELALLLERGAHAVPAGVDARGAARPAGLRVSWKIMTEIAHPQHDAGN
jgi:hypothetical protein